MQAEAVRKFRDLKEDIVREPGETFMVTKKRFSELLERGLVKEAGEGESSAAGGR